jgi:arginase
MKSVLVPYRLAEPLASLADAFSADDAVVVAKGPAGAMVARLLEQTASRVAAHAEPTLVLSGDCTTALAAVAGLQRRGVRPGVVWLDAHADLETPQTTRSGDLGRMALAMLLGRAGAALREVLQLEPLAEEASVLAGARDVEPAEREALDASAVRTVAVDALADAPLPAAPWYVHLDVDLLDPAALPPLRRPVPGGPGPGAVGAALRALAARGTITALGVACTFTAQGLAQPDPLATIRPLIDAAFARTG